MGFRLIVLGCSGGPAENNLSGYLLAPSTSANFIALDAGTLLSGIFKAVEQQAFADIETEDGKKLSQAEDIFIHQIKSYVISHPHLDHIAGLVVNSQNDAPKTILGLDTTIDVIRDHLFNWKVWPNYGNEGNSPQVPLYKYLRLTVGEQTLIPDTKMKVEPFHLSHHKYPSTAFLIEYNDEYLLYFGDTGSDKLEKVNYLDTIWNRIAPLLAAGKLKGMLLECSFPKHPAHKQLYGHLDTQLFFEELHLLKAKVPFDALNGLKVVVTHMKAELAASPDARTIIRLELNTTNDLGIQLIYPQQGMRINF
ncbi:MAG: 3',5'-cyclic-nucleotide phosphodiesterase [Chlamydiia bacterium]|nr:3',5'-cyclic-nucleotide phosphodiesterase [Chlamydiia bacterium]